MTEPTGWACAVCGQAYVGAPDSAGMLTCPAGHRAYSGYVAEAASLQARLGWLEDRVRGGEPRPDGPTAQRYGIWPVTQPPDLSRPGGPEPATGSAAGARTESVGAQVLLLGVGAALLIVAAIVFAAVVWDRLGTGGKVAVMVLATLGCGALAGRLRSRLPGTAEALAVVTFGLAVVDVVAAPALGLVPESWVYPDRAYLAVVAAVVGAVFVLLGRVQRLRAWSWLGWSMVALAAALLTWWLMLALEQPWRGLALSVLSLTAVGLAATAHLVPALVGDRRPLELAALVAAVLSVLTLPAALYDLDRAAFLGSAVTVLVTAAAVLVLARRTESRALRLVSAALGGAAGGLVLLGLPETESIWPAVVAAVSGCAALWLFLRLRLTAVGLIVSAVAWATWGIGRLAAVGPATLADPVYLQLAVVLAAAAVSWWVVAWTGREPYLAWAAAVVAEVGWLCAVPRLTGLPELPETKWLPFSLFLLVGGWVWQRTAREKSLAWLGPATTVALLPPAVICWAAPWVYPLSDQSDQEAMWRLVLVLAGSLLAVVVGVRLRLAGLLVPGAVALAVVAGAQVWSGALAMPRWVAIGIAGAALIALGARIEWLRLRGQAARDYLSGLE